MRKQKQGNGLPAKAFLPTHRTRVWFVEAEQTLIKRTVKTADGDVEADVGDYIVVYGNGATTVMKREFFEASFEPIKVDDVFIIKEDENE